MPSWQTELLNLYLSVSVKPILKYVDSVESARRIVLASDSTLGRLSIPFGTRRTAASITDAQFNAEWVEAGNVRPESVLMYLPGGAYVLRMPNTHAGMVSRLCKQASARALIVYYRLAPEFPFPACVEGSLLAYRWLLDQHIPADRIAIAGDSAGGGLTLSTLLAMRDAGLPMPACAYMVSPLLDVRDQAPSRWKNAISDAALPPPKQRGVNPRELYLGDNDPRDPMVSPINGDFTGLPPMYIQVSDSELLLDDSLRLARRAHTFDVDVTVDLWHRVPHVWPAFPFLPESHEALKKSARFLRKNVADLDEQAALDPLVA